MPNKWTKWHQKGKKRKRQTGERKEERQMGERKGQRGAIGKIKYAGNVSVLVVVSNPSINIYNPPREKQCGGRGGRTNETVATT